MYANLIVRVGRKVATPARFRRTQTVPEETLAAWKVEADGITATVYLDGNDGNGNYAEPAGERVINLTTHTIQIGADF